MSKLYWVKIYFSIMTDVLFKRFCFSSYENREKRTKKNCHAIHIVLCYDYTIFRWIFHCWINAHIYFSWKCQCLFLKLCLTFCFGNLISFHIIKCIFLIGNYFAEYIQFSDYWIFRSNFFSKRMSIFYFFIHSNKIKNIFPP